MKRYIRSAIYNGFDESEFDNYQLREIDKGLKHDVDISYYADPKFDWQQMEQIERGLNQGVDISVYANPEFDSYQMNIIREALLQGLPIESYAVPSFNHFQLYQILLGLKNGVDVSVYADSKIPYNIMENIRRKLQKGIDVDVESMMSRSGRNRKYHLIYVVCELDEYGEFVDRLFTTSNEYKALQVARGYSKQSDIENVYVQCQPNVDPDDDYSAKEYFEYADLPHDLYEIIYSTYDM